MIGSRSGSVPSCSASGPASSTAPSARADCQPFESGISSALAAPMSRHSLGQCPRTMRAPMTRSEIEADKAEVILLRHGLEARLILRPPPPPAPYPPPPWAQHPNPYATNR